MCGECAGSFYCFLPRVEREGKEGMLLWSWRVGVGVGVPSGAAVVREGINEHEYLPYAAKNNVQDCLTIFVQCGRKNEFWISWYSMVPGTVIAEIVVLVVGELPGQFSGFGKSIFIGRGPFQKEVANMRASMQDREARSVVTPLMSGIWGKWGGYQSGGGYGTLPVRHP